MATTGFPDAKKEFRPSFLNDRFAEINKKPSRNKKAGPVRHGTSARHLECGLNAMREHNRNKKEVVDGFRVAEQQRLFGIGRQRL